MRYAASVFVVVSYLAAVALAQAPQRATAVDLEWTPAPGSDGVPIFTAVREQLGLRLEPAGTTLDVVIIERAERPTPN